MAKPDLVVYLQADTGRLMERIKERGREMEVGVDKKYIDDVNRAFNEYFFNYKEGPLLIINTNQINFVKNEGDLNTFLRHHGVAGIAGIDTRRLTRHIRDAGSMAGAFGSADTAALKARADGEAGTAGGRIRSVQGRLVDAGADVRTHRPR